jgi:hypothetical protein
VSREAATVGPRNIDFEMVRCGIALVHHSVALVSDRRSFKACWKVEDQNAMMAHKMVAFVAAECVLQSRLQGVISGRACVASDRVPPWALLD